METPEKSSSLVTLHQLVIQKIHLLYKSWLIGKAAASVNEDERQKERKLSKDKWEVWARRREKEKKNAGYCKRKKIYHEVK